MNKFIYTCQLSDIIIHILESGHFNKITRKIITINFSLLSCFFYKSYYHKSKKFDSVNSALILLLTSLEIFGLWYFQVNYTVSSCVLIDFIVRAKCVRSYWACLVENWVAFNHDNLCLAILLFVCKYYFSLCMSCIAFPSTIHLFPPNDLFLCLFCFCSGPHFH